MAYFLYQSQVALPTHARPAPTRVFRFRDAEAGRTARALGQRLMLKKQKNDQRESDDPLLHAEVSSLWS
jgi:hypothetical protein